MKKIWLISSTLPATGQPKGVMVTHCGIVNLLQAQSRPFSFARQQVAVLSLHQL